MHADKPKPDDLSNLESRLAAWQPAPQGLDADRMLYAAGQASVQRRTTHHYWQGVSCVLTVLVVVLGIELKRERAERDAGWAHHSPTVAPATQETPATAEPLSSASLFAARRALDAGIDAWQSAEAPTSPGSESPNAPILQVWQAERLLER